MQAARSASSRWFRSAQLLIGLAGWQPAMMLLGATGLVSIPLILWLTVGGPRCRRTRLRAQLPLREAIGEAAVDRSYLLLNIGFFTCGFHVAFIATHLPGIVATCELPAAVGAWSLADHRPFSTSPAAFGSEEPSRNGE
jgi:hypothetical protein